MRINRLVRIGLAILSVGVLLWVVSRIFGHHDTTPAPTTTATATGDGTTTPADQGGHIVAAREDIPDHTIITREMLKDGGAASNTAGFITNPDDVIGFITGKPILANEKFKSGLGNGLLGHITQVGIAGTLRPGMRAIVVPIAKPTLHDLVKIGNYVDIVASSQGEEARTIVQNVRVLAVDVFGRDYPPVKVAQRGDYKAPAVGVSAANPATSQRGASAAPVAAAATPNPNGAPAPAPAAPTPTPPPAPAPAAALTLEVSPADATALSLAIASTAVIDFLLRSPYEPGIVAAAPGAAPAAIPAVYTTRTRLFPFASRKGAPAPAAAPSGAARTVSTTSGRGGRTRNRPSNGPPIDFPPPGPPGGGIPEPPHSVSDLPATYQIPIYIDGKLIRYDTVRRPQ